MKTAVLTLLVCLLPLALTAQEAEPTTAPTTETEAEATPAAAEPGPIEVGLPETASEAARDAARACDGGDLVACNRMATLYFVGTEGVTPNNDLGNELDSRALIGLQDGCEAGDSEACDNFRRLYGDEPGE